MSVTLHLPKVRTVFGLLGQPIVAEGLARLLDTCPDLDFVGYSADPKAVADEVLRLRPALLIADQGFGLGVVCEVLAAIKRRGHGLPVVLWSPALSAGEQRMALDAGVSGLLDRALGSQDMLECFRSVLEGSTWTEPLAAGNWQAEQRIADRLTKRELEVMTLVQEGLKNREIGDRLQITPGTVKVHLLHVFEKAGVRDRHELSLKAMRLLSHLPKEEAPRQEPAGEWPLALQGGTAGPV